MLNATPSELLMRNFNEIFIKLDPVRHAALLAESFTDINEAVSEIRRHFPEYRYTVTNKIQTMDNIATCSRRKFSWSNRKFQSR
jgi:hypothetical protein